MWNYARLNYRILKKRYIWKEVRPLDKKRTIVLIISILLALIATIYIAGAIGQVRENHQVWLAQGGMRGDALIAPIVWHPAQCLPAAFRPAGLTSLLVLIFIVTVLGLYLRYNERFRNKQYDARGFVRSKSGTYGTADWMNKKAQREVLEARSVSDADGIILGVQNGKVICLPKNTRLNRHIAIFGASGTMKSRGIIRPALFTVLKRGESAVVTDPKGELYADTAELFRNNGYEVKVFNLVHPDHSDAWNCMSELRGDTLMAQLLTNVIISNTGSEKGDHFWDNGEANLLKALVLYVDQDPSRTPDDKNLAAVYHMLTNYTEDQLSALFEKLPLYHPARAPYNLFAQSSDTVRTGIILGLGTRLQVLQNQAVCNIINRNDIDLTAPGKRKCIYYVILSDQDTTMAFLSSLFFSFLFIYLTRYADSQPNSCCDVPVNLIFDEFNNVGRLGSASDGSDFARTLSVIRSRKIYVMLAMQSLGQLQNRYPNTLWAEIIGNTDIQLMLGCTDDLTAKYFSDRSGEMSVEVTSTMTMRQTFAIAQVIPQYRQSEGVGKRKLLTPDEVLRLPNDELLVAIRECNLLRLKKFDYTAHPYAAQLVRSSVLEYQPVRPTRPTMAKPVIRKKEAGAPLFNAFTKPPKDF